MTTQLFNRTITCFTALLLTATVTAQDATFEGLGFITNASDAFSQAQGISADGSVVTGVSYSIHEGIPVAQAFRWENGVMEGIGMLPTTFETPWSYATAISADGSTIVGYSMSDDAFMSGWEAMRWTQDGGMEALGDFVLSDYWSESTDVSADGSIVVGRSIMTGQAFRWENGVLENLHTDDVHFIEAYGVSADGSKVVGSAIVDGVQQASIWIQGEGVVGLGTLTGNSSFATGVSSDGSVVVGSTNNPQIAFRWTQENGMTSLGTLGGAISMAEAVSDDGSVIVGWSQIPGGDANAFIWTEENGMQNLQSVLENSYGLDLSGWTFTVATAISADGKTIVGYGTNPDGNQEAWRVVLPEDLSIMDFNTQINVYPNPTTDIVNIQTNGKVETINVYNLAGQKITVLSPNAANKSVDLSGFSAGMYFVEVTVDGHTSKHKIIKK